jgi:hypothetical protein
MDRRDRRVRGPHPLTGRHRHRSRGRFLDRRAQRLPASVEQIATRKWACTTGTALHRTRVLAGGLTGDELAVDNHDDLTVGEVASAVQQLTDIAA